MRAITSKGNQPGFCMGCVLFWYSMQKVKRLDFRSFRFLPILAFWHSSPLDLTLRIFHSRDSVCIHIWWRCHNGYTPMRSGRVCVIFSHDTLTPSFNLKHFLSTMRAWHVVVGTHRRQRHVAFLAVPRRHCSCKGGIWYCTMAVKITVKRTKRKDALGYQLDGSKKPSSLTRCAP